MNYEKTTPQRRYELNIDEAKADLKYHGFDFGKARSISQRIADISNEFGETPELALALIVSGWNAKCMAKLDQEYLFSYEARRDSDEYKASKLFQIIDALANRYEDNLYEVIFQWKK